MENLGLRTISTFSLSHLIYVGIAFVLFSLFYLIFFKLGDKAKKGAVFALSLLGFFAIVGTSVYRYLTISNFDIFANLPITLCGVALIFGMLFGLTNVASMKSFVGYVGFFAGLYGILVLPTQIIGSLSFDLQTILYFVPYIILFACSGLIFTLKLARPTFKNMGISIVTLILVTCFIHVLNTAFIIYDVSYSANYFMTISPLRDEVAQLIFEYIPASFVYLFAYLILFIVISLILTLLYPKKKENVETYAIDENLIKPVQNEVAFKIESEQEAKDQVVKTELKENDVQFMIEEKDANEWKDVIPESVLEEQSKKEQETSLIDDIIIKDEELEPEVKVQNVEPIEEKLEETKVEEDFAISPKVPFVTSRKVEEKHQGLDRDEILEQPTKIITRQTRKVEIKKPEKDYKTYEVKKKPTQIQRKYSFAEADRKRKNDPTLGISSSKRTASQNTELLKDLRYRIDKLGK